MSQPNACPPRSVFREGLFVGQRAIVTGGGTGIGLRIARELAWLGARVVLASRKLDALKKSAALINSECGEVRAYAVQLNIRDSESIKKAVVEAKEKLGGIDILVRATLTGLLKEKGWRSVVDLNLTGTFLMSQEVFNAAFSEQERGAIVNIIAQVWNGMPRMAHTGAARAGVDNLTKTLAVEWAASGVRVNSVAPGIIMSSGLGTYSERVRKILLKAGSNTYAYRLGTEEEVAAAVAFLLSPASAYTTGHTLRVDGGEPLYNGIVKPVPHENMPPWSDAPRAKL